MSKKASELILNSDGSVYHCNLKPEHLADTIITVGDPYRVEKISQYFDSIEFKTQKREIVTHTGFLNGKRLSVISTGMGTDNIDIVLTELDAVANINLATGEPNKELKSLTFVRLGTSGALHKDIPINSILLSSHGLGMDGLLHFYEQSEPARDLALEEAFLSQVNWNPNKAKPYVSAASSELLNLFSSNQTYTGVTATASGFYGPQGRNIRLEPSPNNLNESLIQFDFNGFRITNLEMETAGIYGLCNLLGHKAISLNSIIANRSLGTFSKTPHQSMDTMIKYALEKLTA